MRFVYPWHEQDSKPIFSDRLPHVLLGVPAEILSRCFRTAVRQLVVVLARIRIGLIGGPPPRGEPGVEQVVEEARHTLNLGRPDGVSTIFFAGGGKAVHFVRPLQPH